MTPARRHRLFRHGMWEGGEAELRLLDSEQATLSGVPSVTCVTIFSGETFPVVAVLRERLREVVRLNPWLAGRLERLPAADGGEVVVR